VVWATLPLESLEDSDSSPRLLETPVQNPVQIRVYSEGGQSCGLIPSRAAELIFLRTSVELRDRAADEGTWRTRRWLGALLQPQGREQAMRVYATATDLSQVFKSMEPLAASSLRTALCSSGKLTPLAPELDSFVTGLSRPGVTPELDSSTRLPIRR
jgi:hypothetical protein